MVELAIESKFTIYVPKNDIIMIIEVISYGATRLNAAPVEIPSDRNAFGLKWFGAEECTGNQPMIRTIRPKTSFRV